jgi:hypothetical protein
MPNQRLQKEIEQNNETARSDELLNALRKKPPTVARKTIMPRVKFTGQQPGEEGVERDNDPGPDDDQNKPGEDGEKIVPIGDPPSRRKPSTGGKFSA